jgi:hypothetical protein
MRASYRGGWGSVAGQVEFVDKVALGHDLSEYRTLRTPHLVVSLQ